MDLDDAVLRYPWNQPYNDTTPSGKKFINYRDSLAVPIISSLAFGVSIIQCVILIVLVIVRRNYEPIKKRNALLIVLAVIAKTYIITNTCIRYMVGRSRFPCFLYAVSFTFGPPYLYLPSILRVWRCIVMNEINSLEKLWNFVHDSADNEMSKRMARSLALWRFWISNKMIILAYVTAFVVHILFWIVVPVLNKDPKLYWSFKRSCSVNTITAYIIAAQAFFYLGLQGILLIFTVLRKVYLKYKVTIALEIAVFAQWIVIWAVFTIVNALWWAIYVKAERFWPTGYFVIIGCYLDIFLTVYAPIVCSFRRQKPLPAPDIIEIIDRSSEIQKVKGKIAAISMINMKDEIKLEQLVLELITEKDVIDKYLNLDFDRSLELYKFMTRMIKFGRKDESDDNLHWVEIADADVVGATNKNLRNTDRVEIKYVLIETSGQLCSQKSSLQAALSPIVHESSEIAVELRRLESALMIGPWFLHFNRAGLCIPRKCLNDSSLVLAEIETIDKQEHILSIVEKVSSFIIDVNSRVSYAQLGNSAETMNCQNFVDSLLNHLKLKVDCPPDSSLALVMQELKRKGSISCSFLYSDRFCKRFQLQGNKFKFKSHSEIDSFIHRFQQIDPIFRGNYSTEYTLLMRYDKLFALKHTKVQERKQQLVKEKEEASWVIEWLDPDNISEAEELREKTQILESVHRQLTICEEFECLYSSDSCPFSHD